MGLRRSRAGAYRSTASSSGVISNDTSEEAREAQAAPDGQLASELADVLEVLKALAAAHDMSWEDVVSEADRKCAERGGFGNRIFLEYVDRAR